MRNITWTLNNPTPRERQALSDLRTSGLPRTVVYMVFQEEQGLNGTVHIQGYAQANRAKTMAQWKSVIFWMRRIHLEESRGTALQNKEYCTKEESRVEGGLTGEYGEMRTTTRGAKKGRLSELADKIKEGEDPMQLEDDYPGEFLQYRDKIDDFILKQKGKRNWAMEIEIFYGPTGTGKSYTSNTENPNAYNVPWPTGGRWWWPGYTGQDTVIMDEFRHQIKYDVMLKMMDRYAWALEAKGRSFNFVSKKRS